MLAVDDVARHLLDADDAADADADDRSRTRRIRHGGGQPGIVDRHLRRRQRILDEEIHLLHVLAVDPGFGREVAHLAGDGGRQIGGIEPADAANAGAARAGGLPVGLDAGPQRRDHADAGDDHAAAASVRPVHGAARVGVASGEVKASPSPVSVAAIRDAAMGVPPRRRERGRYGAIGGVGRAPCRLRGGTPIAASHGGGARRAPGTRRRSPGGRGRAPTGRRRARRCRRRARRRRRRARSSSRAGRWCAGGPN